MGRDVGDEVRDGATYSELEARGSARPLTIDTDDDDTDPAAVEALARLAALVEDGQAAQDRAAQKELVIAAREDQALTRGLALAGYRAWRGPMDRIREWHGCARLVDPWAAEIRALQRALRQPRALDLDAWRDLQAPGGYTVNRSGVYLDGDDDTGPTRICDVPMVIEARVIDIQGGPEAVRVGWLGERGPSSAVLARLDIADSRRIVAALAPLGVRGLTSETARFAVEYFAAFERANQALRTERSTRQTGWASDDMGDGFVLGPEHVAPNGAPPVVWRPDPGAEQLVQHVGPGPGSTLEGWMEAADIAARHPGVMLLILVSLAAPLVGPLGAPNVIVDRHGLSSTGKTSSLRVAVSVWGDPGDGRLIGTWQGTAVGLEESAASLRDLPVALDETQLVTDPVILSRMIYGYASGRGKVRGRPDGMRPTASMRGVLLSTGESPAVGRSEAVGTRGRVLELAGEVWTGTDPVGDLAAAMAIVTEHHGVAGPAWVRWLVAHRAELPRWRERYRALCSAAERRAAAELPDGGATGLAGRLGKIVALVQVTAELAGRALGLSDCPASIAAAWAAACAGAVEGDRAAAALRSVWRWAVGRPTSWWGRHERDRHGTPRVPPSGWLGAWQDGDGWQVIAYLPDPLRARLRELGHDPDATLAQWRARGWLRPDGRHIAAKVTIDGARTRCVVVLRSAITDVDGEV